MFEATDANAKGVQSMFSLATTTRCTDKAAHFHIFYGSESQEALFDELEELANLLSK